MPGKHVSTYFPEDEWELVEDFDNRNAAIRRAVRGVYGDDQQGERLR